MKKAWIGADGWGYFRGPSGRPLEDYARGFSFAEVNVTFYRHPPNRTVLRWRRSVPSVFKFAVKAHHAITHRARLRPTREAVSALERDIGIVGALRSEILVLQTPADLQFGPDETKGLRDLSGSMPPRMRVALEARGHRSGPLPMALANALRDIRGIDVVDISRGDAPRVGSDVLYTRLFGSREGNVWEFSDDELRAIGNAADKENVSRAMFAFHGVRMYKDAARFLAFRETGEFPRATRATGLDGLRETLGSDVSWPISRDSLARDHGWKVLTISEGTNVHAMALLQGLPDRQYYSPDDLLRSLRKGSTAASQNAR